MDQINLTIFTPAYNRAELLPVLYQSLQQQTDHRFEWLIVDDGSSDHTRELVEGWLEVQNPFPIRYYRQENGGKHTAINRGAAMAHGELFFIVDSDDTLPPHSVETTLRWANTLPADAIETFCGVCGLKAYSAEKAVGESFDGEWIDCTCLERERCGIRGDKAEVFFTELLRRYPFPVFEGERFVTEAVVWDRMARDGYRLRYFNEITYLCDYLEGGLTNQGMALYFRNPKGYGLYLRQCREFGKFAQPVQTYYEIQCFLAWRKTMSMKQISQLLGIPAGPLAIRSAMYRTREILSPIKQRLLGRIRRNK